jgi:hypothetical protein
MAFRELEARAAQSRDVTFGLLNQSDIKVV